LAIQRSCHLASPSDRDVPREEADRDVLPSDRQGLRGQAPHHGHAQRQQGGGEHGGRPGVSPDRAGSPRGPSLSASTDPRALPVDGERKRNVSRYPPRLPRQIHSHEKPQKASRISDFRGWLELSTASYFGL